MSEEPIAFGYTNWRGEAAIRTAIPKRIYWGSTEWHPEPCWLFEAWDTEKNALRQFALDDCVFDRTVINEATRPAPKGLVEELQNVLGRIERSKVEDGTFKLSMEAAARWLKLKGDTILAALKDRDVVLEEAAERAAFVAGYRAAHMVPDAYDSTSAAEEAWEGYRLVSRAIKERV